MWQFIRPLRKWLAKRKVKYLRTIADDLPSPDQVLAANKRIRYCEIHLKEGTSWRFTKQIMEVRHLADERLLLLAKCIRSTWLVMKCDPNRQLSEELAGQLALPFGKAPSNFEEAAQGFRDCRETWKEIVSVVRRVTNPPFASQVFVRLSEHGRLQFASLAIGSLIASGAVQMMFFYRAAAEQSVTAYWVWDDLAIQAINVVPIALIVLIVSEICFRLLWRFCEDIKHPKAILLLLDHPMFVAILMFLLLVLSASWVGYHKGIAEWNHFVEYGGTESATMLDQTHLTGVHLVGTTSRTAVFLQSNPPEKSPYRHEPEYREVFNDVVCTLQSARVMNRLISLCKGESTKGESTKGESTKGSPYRVYVIDRDKVVCHGQEGQCEGILKWTPKVEPLTTVVD